MDVYDKNLLEFWKALNQSEVQYIMIGGFAVNMQGFARTTEDIDVWIKDTLDNRKKLRQAFKEIDYGDYELLETLEFVPGFTQFYLGGGIVLDILTSMKGLEDFTFDECMNRAVKAKLNDVIVPFLHINDLIRNKKATARPKDIIDVIELEKILKFK